jgi:ABC-type multidrug transport system fused ATPase/permease subunit
LFTNFSRFLVFALGGYLAITGHLALGSLVAFLSAQDKLYDPWKELIRFYQAYQTAAVTYSRAMDYFNVSPENPLAPKGRQPYVLKGNIEVDDLSFTVEDGTRLLSEVSFNLKHGEHMALVGFSGSGKTTLAKCITQLQQYSGGKITLDQKKVSELSKQDIVNNIGFVSQTPFIFEGSIEENLLYAVIAQAEAYAQPSIPDLDDRILALQQTGLFVDVLRFGLNTVLDTDEHKDMVRQILNMRKTFERDFWPNLWELIEIYDPNLYLYSSSVAENILFGDPLDDSFKSENLPKNEIFNKFLAEAELREPLLEVGIAMIEAWIKLSDQRPSDENIPGLALIDPEEIDDYKSLIYKIKKKGIQKISGRQCKQILRRILDFVPQKHEFFHLPKRVENQILKGRALFKDRITEASSGSISFFQKSSYMHTQSILTNIFFGKLKEESADAQEKVNTCIHQLLIKEDFLEDIIKMGMQHPVGTKGDNLSGGQRQKLAIARIFIKKPPIIIMDEATSGLDNDSQARIQNLLETQWKGKATVVSVVHHLDIIENYDQIAVMKDGKIVEKGNYHNLMRRKKVLYELVSGDKNSEF